MKKHPAPPDTPPKSSSRKYFYFAVVALFHLVLLFYFARLDFTLITKIKNGEFFTGSYKFVALAGNGEVFEGKEEDFYHPRLQLLRKRENLDNVISSGRTQFEKIVLIRKWAHQQWSDYTGKFYYPPWDALEILDLVRKHKNYGFCAQYAIVFLQACQSVGIHARYVDLPGHFVTAIWSDEYNRWVIMDPSNDIHYEKNGVPLKGRELCAAYWSNKIKNIYKVSSDGTKTQVKKDELSCYRMYSILLRTNHLTDPEFILENEKPRKLALSSDYRSYPMVGRDSVAFTDPTLAWKEENAKEEFSGKDYTDDVDNFRNAKNQTIIFFAGSHNNIAKIKLLSENSATFKSFLVNIDDTGWRETDSTLIPWQMRAGFNKLSARILTKYGWQGPESHIKIFYKPDWFKKRG